MVSDDLSYNVLKKEFDRIRHLYDEERKKTADLERRLEAQEKEASGQTERLLEDEQRFVSGEETVHSLEQEKIKALSRHLSREHKMRLDETEAKEKLAKDYEKKLADAQAACERRVSEKDEEIAALKEELGKKDKVIESVTSRSEQYKERELDSILNVRGGAQDGNLMGEEDGDWISETQDLIKVLHRWGSIKLDEAAQTMDLDRETVLSYANVLEEKGLIKVDDADSDNPTFRATRNLIGKLNDLKMKMRRRGGPSS